MTEEFTSLPKAPSMTIGFLPSRSRIFSLAASNYYTMAARFRGRSPAISTTYPAEVDGISVAVLACEVTEQRALEGI